MSGDMSMGACRWRRAGQGPLTRAGASSRGSAAARSPSCVKIENVASMAWGGETLISTQFQLQLREAALELRDARAKRRDLGLALVVALGVFGLLASAALDEVELSLAAAAEAVVFEHHRLEAGPRGRGPAARRVVATSRGRCAAATPSTRSRTTSSRRTPSRASTTGGR